MTNKGVPLPGDWPRVRVSSRFPPPPPFQFPRYQPPFKALATLKIEGRYHASILANSNSLGNHLLTYFKQG